MAYYSLDEINDILIKLSQEAPAEIKFTKHERLGILINNPSEEEVAKAVVQDDVPLYACSVCKKKLISAHLLDLHVVENHDSYFDLQKDKKPMVSQRKSKGISQLNDIYLLSVCMLSRGM